MKPLRPVLALALALVGASGRGAAQPAQSPLFPPLRAAGKERHGGSGPLTLQAFTQLAQRLSPAVVNISVLHRAPAAAEEAGPRRRSRELGTGVIVSGKGYVLTNNHVVDNAEEIRIRLHDERELPGRLVGRDETTDLALLKIEPGEAVPALSWAPLGDSDALQIGEWVMAIGNPFGLDHTVTAGIVSAKGRREVQPGGQHGFFDFIQTDASINPGNSGGPLINTRGEVIGINTAINVAGSGIGFAIPSNIVKVIAQKLYAGGRVQRSWLGLYPQPLTEALRRAFRLPDRQGALVAEVVPGSPAEAAGLRAGDVVVRLDGQPVRHADDLTWLLGITEPRTATLQVLRDGQTQEIAVALGEQGAEETPPPRAPAERPSALGITVAELTPLLQRQLGYTEPRGLLVMMVEPGSPAMEAGVERGDVVLQVNGRPVQGLSGYADAMRQVPTGEMIRLLVRREDHKAWRSLWVAFSKR